MKTTIKIHDTKWFKKHCIGFEELIPKYKPWRRGFCIPWLHEEPDMSSLEGQVLEVKQDDGNTAGDITTARYKICGYWIPNWAIEWVKEVSE